MRIHKLLSAAALAVAAVLIAPPSGAAVAVHGSYSAPGMFTRYVWLFPGTAARFETIGLLPSSCDTVLHVFWNGSQVALNDDYPGMGLGSRVDIPAASSIRLLAVVVRPHTESSKGSATFRQTIGSNVWNRNNACTTWTPGASESAQIVTNSVTSPWSTQDSNVRYAFATSDGTQFIQEWWPIADGIVGGSKVMQDYNDYVTLSVSLGCSLYRCCLSTQCPSWITP